MPILLIEDEARIASFIEKGLNSEGYQVVVAKDGLEAIEIFDRRNFELVLLDLLLPGKDGRQVLKEIRLRNSEIPIIVLTAVEDTTSKVDSLDEGASDYITKPFDFEELAARIRAHLRQRRQSSSSILKVGNLSLNLKTRQASCGDQTVFLTTREFCLLEYLLRHPNQVVSRTQILNHVWGYDFDPESNIVDVYVRHLRKKLSPRGQDCCIETVRGAGYRVTG